MCDIIKILKNHLPRFKNVLELGSNVGKDLSLLHEYYEVVASETDKIKTRFLKDNFIDIRVILLDFINLDTHKRFDCIYSRNIYDDFSFEEIETSFYLQKKLLEGEYKIIFHIFDSSKHKEKDILNIMSNLNYELLEQKKLEQNFYILAKSID